MRLFTCFITLFLLGACSSEHEVNIQNLAGFPTQNQNYHIGVAAPFTAKSGDVAVMAGGCNFPNKPAAQKGVKVYYDDIYVADWTNSTTLNWQKKGQLPKPAAYGATVQMPDDNSTLFIGGRNETEIFDDVYRITFSQTLDSVIIDTFPPLPKPRFNMAATVLDDKLYVIGGVVDGKPSNSVISIDLDSQSVEGWSNESDFSGDPRTQLVAVAQASKIFIFGGCAPYMGQQNASVSLSAYQFIPNNNKWIQISSPVDGDGNFVALTAGNATKLDDRYIMLTGGVDKDIFLRALVREQKMSMTPPSKLANYTILNDKIVNEYLTQPIEWYQFNGKVLLYDIVEDTYLQIASSQSLARAGAGTISCEDGMFVISGELKPGVRSPDVTKLTVKLEY